MVDQSASTDEQVERAARALFEDPLAVPEYTWAEMVVEDPSRAEIWREDARRVLVAAGVAPPAPSEERALHYGRDVRNGVHTNRPDGFTDSAWHRAAMADAGASHNLPGRLYIVQCEWCPKAFAANTKAEAMDMFREHERVIQEGP